MGNSEDVSEEPPMDNVFENKPVGNEQDQQWRKGQEFSNEQQESDDDFEEGEEGLTSLSGAVFQEDKVVDVN